MPLHFSLQISPKLACWERAKFNRLLRRMHLNVSQTGNVNYWNIVGKTAFALSEQMSENMVGNLASFSNNVTL